MKKPVHYDVDRILAEFKAGMEKNYAEARAAAALAPDPHFQVTAIDLQHELLEFRLAGLRWQFEALNREARSNTMAYCMGIVLGTAIVNSTANFPDLSPAEATALIFSGMDKAMGVMSGRDRPDGAFITKIGLPPTEGGNA
jgi:hypothetical protein